MKMKDPSVAEIDLLFLFFALVLRVAYGQSLFFAWEKPLVLGGANENSVAFEFYFVCSAAGRQNFQHW